MIPSGIPPRAASGISPDHTGIFEGIPSEITPGIPLMGPFGDFSRIFSRKCSISFFRIFSHSSSKELSWLPTGILPLVLLRITEVFQSCFHYETPRKFLEVFFSKILSGEPLFWTSFKLFLRYFAGIPLNFFHSSTKFYFRIFKVDNRNFRIFLSNYCCFFLEIFDHINIKHTNLLDTNSLDTQIINSHSFV